MPDFSAVGDLVLVENNGERETSKRGFEGGEMKSLACAIIEQAIADLKLWRKKRERKRIAGDSVRQTELAELHKFFQPGGGLDLLVQAAELQINPAAIRRKLYPVEPWRGGGLIVWKGGK